MMHQSMLWGHPVAFWDMWGVRAMLMGTSLGFLALVVSLFSSFVLWRVAGVAQSELETKTASLGVQIETQRRLTAEASARAAALEKEAATVRLEQEKLKASLAWRTLPPNSATLLEQALRRQPGAVNLRWNDGDPEALYLAIQLAHILAKAGWRVAPGSVKPNNTLIFDIVIDPTGNPAQASGLTAAMQAAGVPFETGTVRIGSGFNISTINGAPVLMVGSRRPFVP